MWYASLPRLSCSRSSFLLNLWALNPTFGNLRLIYDWPPSKPLPILPPDLAYCPLWPFPAVLPLPLPGPRPIIFGLRRAPSLSHRLFTVNGRSFPSLIYFSANLSLAANCMLCIERSDEVLDEPAKSHIYGYIGIILLKDVWASNILS